MWAKLCLCSWQNKMHIVKWPELKLHFEVRQASLFACKIPWTWEHWSHVRYCQKQTFMYRHFSSPLHSLKQTILESREMTELLLLEYMKINPLPRVEQPSSKHHLYPFPVHKGSLCFPLGEKASGSCLTTQLGCSSRPSFCSCERGKLLLHSFLYFCLTFVQSDLRGNRLLLLRWSSSWQLSFAWRQTIILTGTFYRTHKLQCG